MEETDYNSMTLKLCSDHEIPYSSSASRPGMYSKLTSKTTGLFGVTLGLPGAEVRPFGNANCYDSKWKALLEVIRTWAIAYNTHRQENETMGSFKNRKPMDGFWRLLVLGCRVAAFLQSSWSRSLHQALWLPIICSYTGQGKTPAKLKLKFS